MKLVKRILIYIGWATFVLGIQYWAEGTILLTPENAVMIAFGGSLTDIAFHRYKKWKYSYKGHPVFRSIRDGIIPGIIISIIGNLISPWVGLQNQTVNTLVSIVLVVFLIAPSVVFSIQDIYYFRHPKKRPVIIDNMPYAIIDDEDYAEDEKRQREWDRLEEAYKLDDLLH